ncbi:MAG TPA: DNA-3-methyladenine glycosylase 2 family protein [Pararobbsia sp.]|nr:DNA-3-methyladenine glycosylase 2 family protein [Pararobbsia sp.]
MATASKSAARKRTGAGKVDTPAQAAVRKTTGNTARKTPAKTASTRATNGAAGPASPSAHAGAARKTSARKSAPRAAEPAVVEQVEPVGEGEVVRKSRATSAREPVASVQTGLLEPTVTRPDYWDRACADLVRRDRILKKLIPQFGPVHLAVRHDPFVTLARSVVGQQISVKAAQAVWERVKEVCPSLAPAKFTRLGFEQLTACGLSKRKAEYILDLAEHFVSGALHVDTWASMDDESVIAELTQIRGIGRWTAEMFLIFNLMRPDVLPLDDIGLIQAISVNYFSGEPVTRSEAREVAANWEPWRTVATWYMWRSLDNVAV